MSHLFNALAETMLALRLASPHHWLST